MWDAELRRFRARRSNRRRPAGTLMQTLMQDFRYAARMLRRKLGPDAGHGRVAGDRHRREHGHLQRRQRAPAASRSPIRTPTAWSFCGCGRRASTSRRTGPRPDSTSTSGPRTARSRRCPSRKAARALWSDSISRSASRRSAPRPACSTCSARKPLYGRLLLPEEDVPGKPPIVVLSHGFWKRLFNADPEYRRQEHHAERLGTGGGDARTSSPSPACCGPTSC